MPSRLATRLPSADWFTALSLVFGGCASNACALELFVADYPHAGTLSTFAQFTLISLIGLTRNLTCDKSVPATHFLAQLHTVLRNRRDIRILVRTNEQDKLLLASFIDDLTGLILSKSPETSVLSVPLRDLSTLSLSNVSNEAVFSTLSALPSSQHSNSSTRTKPDNPTSHKIVVVHGSNTSAQLDHITWDVCLRIENESTVFLSSRSVYFLSHPNTISEPPLGVHRSKYSFYDPALPPWWQLWNVRLKRPSIPIRSWIMQVILFFAVSLLNNLAFGYRVPMPIHIVFRSGGSVVNMIIGWMSGRRYIKSQVIAVVLVTAGVVLTTLSALQEKSVSGQAFNNHFEYLLGVALLSAALLLSGWMGILQDRLYSKHGRGHWQEALFYLHFLALPFTAFTWPRVVTDARYMATTWNLKQSENIAFGDHRHTGLPWEELAIFLLGRQLAAAISLSLPLLLIVVTQMICVLGVHRLTAHVESLTVSLVLTARKALSLCLSVLVLRGESGNPLLWGGAGLVFVGTFAYTVVSQKRKKTD